MVQKDAGDPCTVHSFLQSDLNVQQPLHISLSAPLVLTTDEKDAFRDAMIRAIEASSAYVFDVTPTGLSWVSNFDESRHFLVLKLAKPANDELNKLLRACNACASSWGMDRLYASSTERKRAQDVVLPSASSEDRSSAFHISIAWTLQTPTVRALGSVATQVNGSLRDTVITFSSVKIKIGNVVSNVPLLGQPS
jgi:U6 snRNA phosphodiesterase